MEGYAKWKSENKPDKKTYLLLHTYWKEGWGIHKLAAEYDITPEEILTTYACKGCHQYQVKKYSGEDQNCPHCHSQKSQVTTSVGFGIRENQLNEIYKLHGRLLSPIHERRPRNTNPRS